MLLSMFLLLTATTQPASDERPPTDTVRIGMMSGVPEKWNVEKNFETFLALVAEADAQKADVFITPECWLDGYAAPDPESSTERLKTVAQDLDSSPYLQRVAQEARDRGMYICFGFTSIEAGEIFNSAGLWNDKGERVGVYHKTHLQTHDLQYAQGQEIPVWPSPWGPLGIMICADRRWPETVRTLRLQGARLILNPTYGFFGDLNEAIMRTRAFENQCFIAFTHPEESLITGPKGGVEAKREASEPGVLVQEVDLGRARTDNHLQDRRPDLYGIIAAQDDAAKPEE